MLRLLIIAVAAILLGASYYIPSAKDHKIALILGNSDYQSLANHPAAQANVEDFAAALRRRGFTVIEGINLNRVAMKARITHFAAQLNKADVSLFYYSGNVIQNKRGTYLAPSDISNLKTANIEFSALAIDPLLQEMQRRTQRNLVFFDACLQKEHANVNAPAHLAAQCRALQPLTSNKRNMLIAYNTRPGHIQPMPSAGHSPFTQSLIKQIEQKHETIATLTKAISRDVQLASNQQQHPWVQSTLRYKIAFLQEAQTPLTPALSSHADRVKWAEGPRLAAPPFIRKALADQKQLPVQQAKINWARPDTGSKDANSKDTASKDTALKYASSTEAPATEPAPKTIALHNNAPTQKPILLKTHLESAAKREQRQDKTAPQTQPHIQLTLGKELPGEKPQAEKNQQEITASEAVSAEAVDAKTQNAKEQSPGEIYKTLQLALKSHRCKPGAIDGLWGPRSQAALNKFKQTAQKKNPELYASLSQQLKPGPQTAVLIAAQTEPFCAHSDENAQKTLTKKLKAIKARKRAKAKARARRRAAKRWAAQQRAKRRAYRAYQQRRAYARARYSHNRYHYGYTYD